MSADAKPSDTPRTEKVLANLDEDDDASCATLAKHARLLERELAAAKQARDLALKELAATRQEHADIAKAGVQVLVDDLRAQLAAERKAREQAVDCFDEAAERLSEERKARGEADILISEALSLLQKDWEALRQRCEAMRVSLEGIASLQDKTLLGPDRTHEEGANAAFSQCASLARAALTADQAQEGPDLRQPVSPRRWVLATCLMFGASVATAYQVAGLFVKGLEEPPK